MISHRFHEILLITSCVLAVLDPLASKQFMLVLGSSGKTQRRPKLNKFLQFLSGTLYPSSFSSRKNLSFTRICRKIVDVVISALYPESFCGENLAVRKVFAFSDSVVATASLPPSYARTCFGSGPP